MAKTAKASAGRKKAKKKKSTKATKKKVTRKARATTAAVKHKKAVKKAAARPTKSARTKTRRTGKKLKTYLTRKELEEFRQMLLEKRREILGAMSGMQDEAISAKGAGNLSSLPTHMADVGTDNFEHEFTLGLLESEQALLREIDEQLRRIDEGTYGICMGTGKPIPKARLRAKPWAKYTVEYTRMLEKGLVPRPEDQDEQEPQQEEQG